MSTIAYLAPEIPALSATFVYEELLNLEKRGVRIYPFSVHATENINLKNNELASRVIYLYESNILVHLIRGLILFPTFGFKVIKAFGQLIADIYDCGPLKLTSWKLAFQFLVALRLANKLRKLKCEHLHVHFAHVPTQIAMYASTMSGVPFTVTAHANDIFERGILLKQKAERALKFLTISEFNRTYLEEIGLARNKLAVVRCGVNFELTNHRLNQFADKSVIQIGTLGRLVEKKGVDILIRAVYILFKSSAYDVRLSIAGDGPLLVELQSLVSTLGLTDIVTFVGSLSHSNVAEWMSALDVFVLACKKDSNGDMDGIPVVLMEAMSQSVPVISTQLSGIPELVIHGETGLLAIPNDADDLSQQLLTLIETKGLADRLTKNAQLHVKNEFSRDVNLDRLQVYFDK
jgi:glycosyltransferase involved in cell wall biosynthesis